MIAADPATMKEFSKYTDKKLLKWGHSQILCQYFKKPDILKMSISVINFEGNNNRWSHNKCERNMMINVLEIRRHDSAVVNATAICNYFCMMKRQDGTFLP